VSGNRTSPNDGGAPVADFAQPRSDAVVSLPVRAGAETVGVLFGAPSGRDRAEAIDAGVSFDARPGHVYLTTSRTTNFERPPPLSALPVLAERRYALRGRAECDGGEARLWVMEYDGSSRLARHVIRRLDGPFELLWRSHARCESLAMAIRLTGQGYLRFVDLELEEQADASAASDGGDAACGSPGDEGGSIFLDPSGSRVYAARHHRFYDDREPTAYEPDVRQLAGVESLLDVGCGPGLLLRALCDAGVGRVLGLERDAVYLKRCRELDLPVVEHDLNLPFPFVASESFDAVVLRHSLDYLAPIAMRAVLREARRVLRPSGRLFVRARNDGQLAGDVCRTIRLTEPRVRRLLEGAGFTDVDIATKGHNFRALARRPAGPPRWETQAVTLADGRRLRPWSKPTPVFDARSDEQAWDRDGARDFTLLTTPDKCALRVNRMLTAYFTGYRNENDRLIRGICRAVSDDGVRWRRDPERAVLLGSGHGWDADGVAAGSVIRRDDLGGTYLMYYSGRSADGVWPGIGLARSDDGMTWRREDAGPLLMREAFDGLRHLALADVLLTSAGDWLMHCEGWIEGGGWGVFAARSPDGLAWTPLQAGPVLSGERIEWGGRHAANPKCVEMAPGRFLLGFNATDDSSKFQLGLAESDDGRAWRPIAANPVICGESGGCRMESLFMARDALDESQRVYFFSTTEKRARGGVCLTACADPGAEWVGPQWSSTRRGLYRVRDGRLEASAGAVSDEQGLRRTFDLTGEAQCSFRIEASDQGRGCVALSVEGAPQPWRIEVFADGSVEIDGRPAETEAVAGTTPARPDSIAVCLRLVQGERNSASACLHVWRGDKSLLVERTMLRTPPTAISVTLRVPPGEPDLAVEHLDLWTPERIAIDPFGDAHMYMGVCGSGDPLLPDVPAKRFIELLDEHRIERALVAPYGSPRALDGFDQIGESADQAPGRVYPLMRFRGLSAESEAAKRFELNQLEVLWQSGRLFGLKVHMGADVPPPAHVLEWADRRGLLTMWHVCSRRDMEWLETDVLSRYGFPVLLSHFGGYPLDRQRYETAIGLMDRFEQLHLVSSLVWFEATLKRAIERHPRRVLMGSDSPAVDPTAARGPIERLAVSDAAKSLVLSENLRRLVETVQSRRWAALQNRDELLFPPLPADEEQLAAQGFEIVTPGELDGQEQESARDFWAGRGVRSWYDEDKPWATWIADLVRDLQPASVLEFGCNVGRNLDTIRRAAPDVRLCGFDINPDAVTAGREKTELDLRCGDENTLAGLPDGAFDFVFTVSVLDHIADIREACRQLLRVAAKWLFLLEVRLPVEGKVLRHFDHHAGAVKPSTGASYSWHLERFIQGDSRVVRLERRPIYLHEKSLGPYYWAYTVFLSPAS
jgi:SAM-dependent methyltransferase